MRVDLFDFDLPEASIALRPAEPRDAARLLVVSPSFVSDCLETLEELGHQGRHTYLRAGGESYELVPCVNGNGDFARGLARAVERI